MRTLEDLEVLKEGLEKPSLKDNFLNHHQRQSIVSIPRWMPFVRKNTDEWIEIQNMLDQKERDLGLTLSRV